MRSPRPEEQGLAEEAPLPPDAPRPVGRPAKRYRFRRAAGHVAGLDIGPHKVLCLVADLRGDIVASARADVGPEMSAAKRLAAARTVLRRATRGRSNLRALGVGTTGVVSEGKVVVSDRLPDWQGLDLAGALGSGRSHPVLTGNDTKLAALAEHWRGAAQGTDDLIYLLIGRSISLGLMLGGKLQMGYNGAAGEVGVLRDFGWYTAFDRFLTYGTGEPAARSSQAAKRVFDAVRQGDPEATAVVRAFVADLATGVAATVLTVDPQLVSLLDVQPGWRCWEVGAGGGSIARWLAGRAGAANVVSTDLHIEPLLALAELGIQVIRHDVSAEEPPGSGFDLIHARALLDHLPSREEVVARLAAALAPGGWLVIDAAWLAPEVSSEPAISRMAWAMDAIMNRTMGTDMIRWPRTLPRSLEAVGLVEVSAQATVPAMRGGSAQAGLVWYTLDAISQPALAAGLMTEDEIQTARDLLTDPSFVDYSYGLITARGRRDPQRGPRP
jgi:predicted NBD/HSP70 family sugar kinase